jgi:hypothetical protein
LIGTVERGALDQAGAGHGLAGRFGIGRVVLLPLDVRLDAGRRHEAHAMTKPRQLARPMMRALARLHADQRRLERGEERQQLRPAQRLADEHRSRGVQAVHLEDVLGQIQPDRRDRHLGSPPLDA